MKKEYFYIYFGEDGISITPHTRKEIEKILEDEPETEFVNVLSDNYYMDGGVYPCYKVMIIKGELVVPKPVEIVKRLEI